ncbi:MAG: DEAD/DEAH box helicase, partial [Candidatus Aenigmarchaeota archaeon]|nr:DEAD/DEAH box helicase [Candidatus Aenigmarchaeota archaeon]
MAQDFVKHRLIKENTIQARAYQANILATAMKKNTLCVLPTGLGKTPVSVLLAVKRLEEYPESKILVLAPTRPLVNQHHEFFLKTVNIEKERFAILTGMIKPELRGEIYKEKQIIFATPQTIKNDLIEKRLSLKDFSLLVLDETHHAVGEYAYPYIAKKYKESAEHQRILGLTASPGGTREKIKEICKNIGIEAVEVRTEIDEDVTPWVKKKETWWIYVELPESFKKIRSIVNEEYTKKLNTLKKFGFLRSRRVYKKDLLSLQSRLYQGIKEGDKKAILGMSFVTQAIKLEYVLTLLETQGIRVLEKYWKKLRDGKSKSNERLVKNKNVSNAMWLTHSLFEQGSKHPKIGKLCSIVNQQLREKPDSKIIVFANYRESVKEIVNSLGNVENARPVEFVGQREGITQKEQNERLRNFREGKYNVLVCTSIGEEGLDIPEMDLAVFYEPVPSGIRSIQRRG